MPEARKRLECRLLLDASSECDHREITSHPWRGIEFSRWCSRYVQTLSHSLTWPKAITMTGMRRSAEQTQAVGQICSTSSMAHNLAQCRIVIQKAVSAGAKVSKSIYFLTFDLTQRALDRHSFSRKPATTLEARLRSRFPSASLQTSHRSCLGSAKTRRSTLCQSPSAFTNRARIRKASG